MTEKMVIAIAELKVSVEQNDWNYIKMSPYERIYSEHGQIKIIWIELAW